MKILKRNMAFWKSATALLAIPFVCAATGSQASDRENVAQVAPPTSTPSAPSFGGPAVPGVCVFSQEELIAKTKVGQASNARLRLLSDQAQTELATEKAKLDKDGLALAAKRATLTPAQLKSQVTAFNQRAQALQEEAGMRSRQLDATRSRAVGRLLREAQPYVAQAYAAHNCGLLISRDAILAGNTTNDLTAEIIVTVDAKVAPFTIELEPPSGAK